MSLLMDAAGHRYWGLAVGVGMGVALGGAVWFYVRGLHSARADLGRFNLFVFAAPRLGILQLLGFALLEASERTLWGAGLAHPMEERMVVVGLLLQIVVAIVSASVLSLLAKLAKLVAGYFKRTIRAPKILIEFGPGAIFSPRVLLLAGGGGARGPPRS